MHPLVKQDELSPAEKEAADRAAAEQESLTEADIAKEIADREAQERLLDEQEAANQ